MRNTLLLTVLGAVIVTIIGLVAADSFGLLDGRSLEITAAIVATSALGLTIGSGVFGRYRQLGGGRALVHVAIWLAVGCAFALLFRFGGPLTENFR